jgi:hypothetical protein
MTDVERYLELGLASKIAAKNPQLALNLGRQSLEKGFSTELVSVLSQLHPKNKDASLSLYREIVDKLKRVNLLRDPRATELALDLALEFQPPEVDEMVYRELIGILSSALASVCANASPHEAPQICYAIRPLFSRIEKYNSPRAATLRHWNEVSERFGPPPGRVREVIDNGTVDEILALAPKYPEMLLQLHWAAMSKSEASGDIARARQIASDYPGEEQRRHMLAQIDRNQRWRTANAEKLAAIQQEVSQMRDNDQRIQLLLHMASQVAASDRTSALTLLSQAGEIIDSTKPGKTQLRGQIRLAILYCALKSDRGFTIMETLMPRLNEVVAAAAVLDGLENNYLREGEWNMTGEGFVGGLLTHLAQNAGCFAVQDFDRSVTLARQFERSELRLMAQLRIAQGVLTNQPNPLRLSQ